MEGGHKGKEEGKRRRDEGKWPPPLCHMGGGLSQLCVSLSGRPLNANLIPFLSHLLLPHFVPLNVSFSLSKLLVF